MTKRDRKFSELKALRRRVRRLTHFLAKRDHIPGPKTREWYQAEARLTTNLKSIMHIRKS